MEVRSMACGILACLGQWSGSLCLAGQYNDKMLVLCDFFYSSASFHAILFFFFPPARHHKCTGIACKRRKTPCQQGAGRVLGKTCIQPLSLTKSVVISELFLITYWSLVDLTPYKSSFLNGSQLWLSSVPGQRRISSSWWLEEVRSERERTWVAELQVAKVLGRVSRWLT